MLKILLIAAALLWSFPAQAQNPTCPTRPPGDSTNACASTAFVQNALGGGGGGASAIFDTRAELQGANVPASVDTVVLMSYSTAVLAPPATYRRTTGACTQPWQQTSNGGSVCWTLDRSVGIYPQQLGALCNEAADAQVGLQNWANALVDYAAAGGQALGLFNAICGTNNMTTVGPLTTHNVTIRGINDASGLKQLPTWPRDAMGNPIPNANNPIQMLLVTGPGGAGQQQLMAPIVAGAECVTVENGALLAVGNYLALNYDMSLGNSSSVHKGGMWKIKSISSNLVCFENPVPFNVPLIGLPYVSMVTQFVLNTGKVTISNLKLFGSPGATPTTVGLGVTYLSNPTVEHIYARDLFTSLETAPGSLATVGIGRGIASYGIYGGTFCHLNTVNTGNFAGTVTTPTTTLDIRQGGESHTFHNGTYFCDLSTSFQSGFGRSFFTSVNNRMDGIYNYRSYSRALSFWGSAGNDVTNVQLYHNEIGTGLSVEVGSTFNKFTNITALNNPTGNVWSNGGPGASVAFSGRTTFVTQTSGSPTPTTVTWSGGSGIVNDAAYAVRYNGTQNFVLTGPVTLTGAMSGATAVLASIDSINRILYVQPPFGGPANGFVNGETINGSLGGSTVATSASFGVILFPRDTPPTGTISVGQTISGGPNTVQSTTTLQGPYPGNEHNQYSNIIAYSGPNCLDNGKVPPVVCTAPDVSNQTNDINNSFVGIDPRAITVSLPSRSYVPGTNYLFSSPMAGGGTYLGDTSNNTNVFTLSGSGSSTVAVTDNLGTNANMYPVFCPVAPGDTSCALNYRSAQWAFNPNTGAMTIVGPLSLSGGINNLAIVNNGSAATLNIAAGKALQVDNSIRFNGTDGTILTVPAGTVTAAALQGNQTFIGTKTFADGMFALQNASAAGSLTMRYAAGTNGTITWPNGTTDFSATGGTGRFVKQNAAGGPLTVVQPATADLSDAVAWAAYDPGILACMGTYMTATHTGRSARLGKTVTGSVAIDVTDVGSAMNCIGFNLPVGTVSTISFSGMTTNNAQGVICQAAAGGVIATCYSTTGTFIFGNGTTLRTSFTYETP